MHIIVHIIVKVRANGVISLYFFCKMILTTYVTFRVGCVVCWDAIRERGGGMYAIKRLKQNQVRYFNEVN